MHTDDGSNVRGLLRTTAADLASRNDWGGHRTERHRGGIGQQHHSGGLERFDAQRQNHGGGDCHRGAETGQGLQQAAEAERNQNGLDAHVTVAQLIEGPAQVFEPSRGNRDLVEPDGHHDHPHDRHQTEGTTAERGHDRQLNGHMETKNRNKNAGSQRHSGGNMGTGFHPDEHDEKRQQWNACDEC